MEKYWILLRWLLTRPVWALHHIWFSYRNPLSRGKRRIKRNKEYEQQKTTLTEALQRACSADRGQVDRVLKEFKNIDLTTVHESGIIPETYDFSREGALLCYAFVRLNRPEIVVETGVGRGVTSHYILRALEENGKGHLYSIELPLLRRGSEQATGILVPDTLKKRWTLIFGPGVRIMKKLRKKLVSIDMFIHDSNHSYLAQRAEYRRALDWLKNVGILLSDDVENDALLETNEEYGGRLMMVAQNKVGDLGVIVKQV